MWRVGSVLAVFLVLGVYASFLAPPSETTAVAGQYSAYPYLSVTNAYPLSAVTTQTSIAASTPTIYTDKSVDARLVGMLLHIKWLLNEQASTETQHELERLNKQILSLMDDIGEDRSENSGGGALPDGFEVNDSGQVTAGIWQASVIADTYISDILTIGTSSIFANDILTPNAILSSGQVDEYCLTYEGTGNTFEWQTCGGGAGMAASDIDTSAELAAILTDETGTGSVVFSTSPTFSGTVSAAAATLSSTLSLSGSAANIALGSNWLSGDGGDEGVYVDGNGNVGIGTTTPSQKLTVEGDALINSVTVGTGGGNITSNTALGRNALLSNVTGYNSVAIGYEALRSNVGGNHNIAVGKGALRSYTEVTQPNVAVGADTLYFNVSGAFNTAVGSYSQHQSTGGVYNTSLGHRALFAVLTGSYNTAIGGRSLWKATTTASNNTAMGYSALGELTTGANNVALGYQAGDNLTTGSNNIIIGYNIDSVSTTASNRLNIGNLIFGTGLDGTGTTGASGNIGIGTNNPLAKLSIMASPSSTQSTPNTGSVLHITGEDGVSTAMTFDAFGSDFFDSPYLTLRKANGTSASPTATEDADILGNLQSFGYEGGGFVFAADVAFLATENWTPTARGSAIGFNYGRVGATTRAAAFFRENGLAINKGGAGPAQYSQLDLAATALSAPSWTTAGININSRAATLTDTSGAGTVATRVGSSFGVPTFASSNGVTVTNAATLYVAGAPVAGTNTTLTNRHALHVAGGNSYFGGSIGIGTTSPSQSLSVGATTGSQFLVSSSGTISDGTWQGDVISSAYLDSALILSTEIDTSSELAALLSDETGTGNVVFSNSPTFTGTPVLPSSFTIGANTFARSGAFALTLTNTAATNVTFPTSGTLYGTAGGSITSAQLSGSLSNETGSGVAVFGTSPTFTTSANFGSAGVRISDDGDGAITFLGLGNGFDENLILNFDDFDNTIDASSTTGVNTFVFNGIKPSIINFDGYGLEINGYTAAITHTTGYGFQSGQLIGAGATVTGGDYQVKGQDIQVSIVDSGAGLTEVWGTYILTGIGENAADVTYGAQIVAQSHSGTVHGLFVDAYAGGGGSAYAAIFNTGNVGIGTTTPQSKLSVAGDLRVTGAFRDTSGDAGTNGQVLLTTGTGTNWVATSSLGFVAGLTLADINTSSEIAAIVADETGTGALVFANSPTLVTPNLGTPSFLTLTNATGLPISGITGLAAGVGTWLATPTSANLRTALTDETGTGALVFGTAPTFTTSITSPLIYGGTGGSSQLILRSTSGTGTTDDIIMGVGTNGATQAFRIDNSNNSITFGENAGSMFATNDTYNIAVGYNAGRFASTTSGFGAYNTYLGYHAGHSDTGIQNTFVGYGGGSLNTGSYNNFFGVAGSENTGDYNNFIGGSVGGYNTGSSNNFLGYATGANNTGDYNNFIGYSTGASNTGSYNEFIGTGTGELMSASGTVAIGSWALHGGEGVYIYDGQAATTSNNTVIGYSAGYNVATGGDNNILLGYQAADNLTTGNNNIIIGYDIDNVTATADNRLNIGNLIFGTGLDGTGTTLASGNIGIGTSSPSSKLTVSGDLRVTGAFRDTSGDAGTNGQVLLSTLTGTNWTATSTLGLSASFSNSAQLAALLSDETGTGNVVFSNSPTFTGTPVLPSSFTIGANTFARSGAFALTLTTTAATNVTFPTSGTLYGTAGGSITSAQLSGSLSNETGSGVAVFGTSPTFTTSANFGSAGVRLSDDGDGAITFLGLGDGFDENLTLNLDDTNNTGVITSSTGLNRITLSQIAQDIEVYNGANNYGQSIGVFNSTALNSGFDSIVGQTIVANRGGIGGTAEVVTQGQFISASSQDFTGTGTTTTYASYLEASGIGTNFSDFTYGQYIVAASNIGETYGLYVDVYDNSGVGSSTAYAAIFQGGNVGIGTTTPAQKLQVFGNIRVGTSGSNGCIEDYGGGVIGGTCSSDENLKTNIEPIAQEGKSFIDGFAALTPVSYNWNQAAVELYRKDMNAENLGLIAQDVEAQFPELVSENDEGYKQVDFRALPFYIIEALKELWAKVQGQDERLLELEQENEYLKDRIENIEDKLNLDAPAPPPEPEPTPEVPPEEILAPEVPTEPAPEEVVEEPIEEPTYTLVPAAVPTE